MLVSQVGNCTYCIDMNAGMLINLAGWTPDQVAATRLDFNNSPLSAKEKILLALVLKMTRDSNSFGAADMQVARAAGWSDSDILDAVNHGARMVAGDIIINVSKSNVISEENAMNYFRSSAAARLFFLVVSLNVWLGIWLTGFGIVHWWLYIPAIFLLFAAVTGFCPGMILSRMLFKEK